MRAALHWLHYVVGISAGLVIAIIAVTGFCMSYERQITRAQMPAFTEVPVLTPSALMGEAKSITVRRSHAWSVGDRYVNPVTGEKLGEHSEIFEMLEDIHRRLALGDTGRTITGVALIAFIFMLFSGLWLWGRRQTYWFRGGHKTRHARHFDRHHVVGLWAFFPLLLMSLSATVLAFPAWSKTLQAWRQPETALPALRARSVDEIYVHARALVPEWLSITLRKNLSATIVVGEGNQPTHYVMLAFEPETGDIKRYSTYDTRGTGARIVGWARWLHTGEALGILGQTIAAVSALAAAYLFYTGSSLALRRFKRGPTA